LKIKVNIRLVGFRCGRKKVTSKWDVTHFGEMGINGRSLAGPIGLSASEFAATARADPLFLRWCQPLLSAFAVGLVADMLAHDSLIANRHH